MGEESGLLEAGQDHLLVSPMQPLVEALADHEGPEDAAEQAHVPRNRRSRRRRVQAHAEEVSDENVLGQQNGTAAGGGVSEMDDFVQQLFNGPNENPDASSAEAVTRSPMFQR